MLRIYRTSNSTVRFLKYEFYNKLLSYTRCNLNPIYIYIYIERERPIYIYIYILRERERERERERIDLP